MDISSILKDHGVGSSGKKYTKAVQAPLSPLNYSGFGTQSVSDSTAYWNPVITGDHNDNFLFLALANDGTGSIKAYNSSGTLLATIGMPSTVKTSSYLIQPSMGVDTKNGILYLAYQDSATGNCVIYKRDISTSYTANGWVQLYSTTLQINTAANYQFEFDENGNFFFFTCAGADTSHLNASATIYQMNSSGTILKSASIPGQGTNYSWYPQALAYDIATKTIWGIQYDYSAVVAKLCGMKTTDGSVVYGSSTWSEGGTGLGGFSIDGLGNSWMYLFASTLFGKYTLSGVKLSGSAQIPSHYTVNGSVIDKLTGDYFVFESYNYSGTSDVYIDKLPIDSTNQTSQQTQINSSSSSIIGCRTKRGRIGTFVAGVGLYLAGMAYRNRSFGSSLTGNVPILTNDGKDVEYTAGGQFGTWSKTKSGTTLNITSGTIFSPDSNAVALQ